MHRNTLKKLLKQATRLTASLLALVMIIQPVQAASTTDAVALQAQIVGAKEAFRPTENAEAEAIQSQTAQDILLEVCTDSGYGEECAKVLLGMMWKESNNIATAVGDRGKARGFFQIWTKLHKVSLACAQDLACSAEWTLDYMESHGYPRYVNYAVQCHNGCNVPNGYAASAIRHGKRLWSTPLIAGAGMPQLASR